MTAQCTVSAYTFLKQPVTKRLDRVFEIAGIISLSNAHDRRRSTSPPLVSSLDSKSHPSKKDGSEHFRHNEESEEGLRGRRCRPDSSKNVDGCHSINKRECLLSQDDKNTSNSNSFTQLREEPSKRIKTVEG